MERRLLVLMTAPTVVIGLLLFAACLLSAWSVNHVQSQLSRILADHVTSMEAAQELEITMRRLRFHCYRYLIEPRREGPKNDLLGELTADDRAFRQALEVAEQYAYTPQEVEYVGQIRAAYQHFQEQFQVLSNRPPPRSDYEELADRNPVHGTADTAIEAMKQGAFDYLVKPVNLEMLSQVLERALAAARLMHAPAMLPAEDRGGDQIIGSSRTMQEMCKLIGRLAPQDVNVLILGESGSGKELVARALYQHSRRADQPFLAINCAAIPETLLESELFGHEKGAFTGAHQRRIGKFEQCDGGTLFLDEIGDMPPLLQAKMLRLLQEQRFERLGGNETLQTQVRVLAATNQDLDQRVAGGRFRADLYYRLKVVTIAVPPLRERRDDIPELAHYFLFRFNREMDMDLRSLAPETLELLQAYSWPGNVRELQGVIKQTMVNASGHVLLPEFLPETLRGQQPTGPPPAAAEELPELRTLIAGLLDSGASNVYSQVLAAVERILLPQVIQHTQGHQQQASERLGISRATLRHKLRLLGLAVDRIITDADQT